jgi:hypothetical protein
MGPSPESNCPVWSERTSVSNDTVVIDDKMPTKSLAKSMGDIEAQLPSLMLSKGSPPPLALEYRVPAKKKLIYLGGYFLLNLTLTLYNKALLGNVSVQRILPYFKLTTTLQFNFPWLLTSLHAASASLGCFALEGRGYFTPTQLGVRENVMLVAFSFLFTINIAMSNVSL